MPVSRNSAGQFLPGQSGNPSGARGKPNPEVKAILKASAPEAARTLVGLLTSKKEIIRLQAAREILDRTQGKPETMSKIELSTADKEQIVFKWIGEEKAGDINASES